MDDQYEREHAADYQADDDAMEVLRAVAGMVRAAKHLVIVGPYDDQSVCEVQFTDPDDEKLAPAEPVRIAVRGEDRQIVIRASLRRPPVPFSSVPSAASLHAPPTPPTGRSMGGDAIWQAMPDEHGTVAFFAEQLIVSESLHSSSTPAPSHTYAALSCRHVLAGLTEAPVGSPVSMVNRPNELDYVYKLQGVDVAVATVQTQSDYLYREIRALGRIAGVRRMRRNMRVYKFGARTGLTAALVGGMLPPGRGVTSGYVGQPTLWMTGALQLRVFQVNNRFACVHDSGAAVVDDERKFVGLVFSGSSAACNHSTITYVLAAEDYYTGRPHESFYIHYQ